MTLLLLAGAWAGVLDQARDVRRAGDLVAAAELLDTLHPLVEAEEEAGWYLERGIVEELAWRPGEAEPYFREAIGRGGPEAMEARYHLVTVLDELGRVDEARGVLRELTSAHDLNPDFVPVLRIHQGVLDVHDGQVARGVRLIRRGLAGVDDADRFAWAVGRGRFALLDAVADRAEDLEFAGPQRRVTRHLRQRVGALKDVEAELYRVIDTQEPEWITSALLRVGDTYAALADDLAAAPPPRGLTPDQARIYREELARKALGPRTKAWTCYDRGATFADRVGWDAPTSDTLRARRDALAELAPAAAPVAAAGSGAPAGQSAP